MKKDFTFYRKLFTSTFYLSAFTFGGGYVIIPLMRKKFVEQFHWIEETEMLDLTAIAQSAPGPIAVNASSLIGYRLAGFAGAMVSTLGTDVYKRQHRLHGRCWDLSSPMPDLPF